MNIFHQQNKMVWIPDLGQIGAGKVVEFIPRNKKINIPRPSNAPDSDVLFSHTVSGDSLNDFENPDKNIRNGDSLICKENIEISDVTPDKICVVFIHPTCERLAKKVIYVNDDNVILRSVNPHYKDRHFTAADIEIKGIVVGFRRFF